MEEDIPTSIQHASRITIRTRHLGRRERNRIRQEYFVVLFAVRVRDEPRLDDVDQVLPVIWLEEQCLQACLVNTDIFINVTLEAEAPRLRG
jgi:hypothetical protein